MQARRCWVLLMVLVALPAGVLGFSASSALLGLRRPAAVAVDLRQTPSPGVLISPLLRPSRLHCRAAEGEAAGTTAEEDAAAGEEAAEEEAEVDPFAGLELDSKEFLQRKVEVLEKELADANARVGELES